MSFSSSIEWTETTWNPVVGCTKVSSGCKFCYAERMSARLSAMAKQAIADGSQPGRKRHYQDVVGGKGRWTRRISLVEEALDDPFRWKKPRVVFVNSMSDLFHEAVPTDYILRVFEVMTSANRHTFQVLTKRPKRARVLSRELEWPPNVWLGTSVEADDVVHRVDDLRAVPAFVRFLSLEPLLGPLYRLRLEGIDWMIVGGESGPSARPIDPSWVRDLRDQARRAEVPFFFKQWGGRNKKASGRLLDGKTWDEMPAT